MQARIVARQMKRPLSSTYNDSKLKKGAECLLTQRNRRSFRGGWTTSPWSRVPPGWHLACRPFPPHLVKLGLIAPDVIGE